MSSPRLNPEQAIKQKEALATFHANPDKPTSKGVLRSPKALSVMNSKMKEMLPQSLLLIDQLLKGEKVDKARVDSAWKVVATVTSNEKAILDNTLQRMKVLEQQRAAEKSGLIPTEDPQAKAKELAAKGQHIKKLEVSDSWEEDDEDEDE